MDAFDLKCLRRRIWDEDIGEQCGNRRSLLGGENKEYSKVSWTHGGRMDEGKHTKRIDRVEVDGTRGKGDTPKLDGQELKDLLSR